MEQFLNLPAALRRALLMFGDTLAVLIAVWASFAIRLGEMWPALLQDVVWLFPLAVVILIPAFALAGLYRPILRYADESLLYAIVLGASTGILLMMAVWVFLREGIVPRSSWLIAWMVLIALVGGGRLLLRRYLRRRFRLSAPRTPVIIYGAGDAGVQLVQALRYSTEFEPVVFVDDKSRLWGSVVLGLKVRAPAKLPRLIASHAAGLILLALPSASHQRRREILEALAGLPVRVMALPTLGELTSGVRRIDEFREIEVEDIGRGFTEKPYWSPALADRLVRNCVGRFCRCAHADWCCLSVPNMRCTSSSRNYKPYSTSWVYRAFKSSLCSVRSFTAAACRSCWNGLASKRFITPPPINTSHIIQSKGCATTSSAPCTLPKRRWLPGLKRLC